MQFIKVQPLNLFENYFYCKKNLKYKWTISAENTIKIFLSPHRILCQIILLKKKNLSTNGLLLPKIQSKSTKNIMPANFNHKTLSFEFTVSFGNSIAQFAKLNN